MTTHRNSVTFVASDSSADFFGITTALRPEPPPGIGSIPVDLILLIPDRDHPFGYHAGNSAEDVSLKPLDGLVENLKAVP